MISLSDYDEVMVEEKNPCAGNGARKPTFAIALLNANFGDDDIVLKVNYDPQID